MKRSAINNEKNTSISESTNLDNTPFLEIDGINAGLEDIKAGRVLTHEDVMARINQKLHDRRLKINK